MRETIVPWHSHAEWLRVSQGQHQRDAEAVATAIEPVHGCCDICGVDRVFDGLDAPVLRESLQCRSCGNNSRQRAAAAVLLDKLECAEHARVYCTEQASAFYLGLRQRVGQLLGSEYAVGLRQRLRLTMWLWRHGVPAWLRCEDVTALRLATASLDGVVSLDVLEHVPDYRAALGEFSRVLRPGGLLVLTIPFHDANAASRQIAWLEADGTIRHLGAPEFHGDPLSGGVLCFHHFGWDLLAAIGEAGFTDVAACRVCDVARGLPQGQWVLRATRQVESC